MRGSRRRRRRTAGVALLACAWLLATGSAAMAHPVGLPSFALVEVTGAHTFTVEWTPAPDDLVVLARSLGLPAADRAALSATEEARLLAAPSFRDYLAAHAAAHQSGEACASTVELPADLAERGPRFAFRCPEALGAITLRLDPLTDLDARYRTLAVVPGREGDQQVLFSDAAPTRVLELGSGGGASAGGGNGTGGATPSDTVAPSRARVATDAFGGSFPFEQRLVGLVDGPPSLGLVAGGLLLALVIGAAHALAPGHGKTIAAAYLVGDRGRPRDAVLLGVAVSGMHTVSVLGLGAALWWFTARPSSAALTGWLSLASGLAVLTVGAWLLHRRAVELRHGGYRHAHEHDATHEHGAGHHHGHTHLPAADVHPLSRRGLVTLGAAGGLLPSPSALLVLLTALSLGRVVFGLALVGAFSLGLAATLATAGLAVVWGRDRVRRRAADSGRFGGVLRLLPVLGAAAVLVLGIVLTGRAATLL